MVIGGSIFPHKDIHKYTWVSPDGRTKNQIDHVTINRKWRNSLKDVRTLRGADINSDHVLIRAELTQKLKTLNKKLEFRKKYDIQKLKDTAKREEFAIELKNRFQILAEELVETDIEESWIKIKDTYSNTAEEVLGYRKRNHKEWITTDTLQKIETRMEIKQKKLNEGDSERQKILEEQYQLQDREVKRSARRDKRNYIETLAAEAEQANIQNNTKELYNITRKLSGKSNNNHNTGIQDKNGKLITNQEQQLKRWAEFIGQAFEVIEPEEELNVEDDENTILNINTNKITKTEIRAALKSMKNGKAAGCDDIPVEILKADVTTTTDVLYQLFNKIWEKEEIPEEWRSGLLVKLPKKGDLTRCENWRGITLLCITSKVLTRIMLDRMKAALDQKLRQNQAGFRAKRSCVDHIATL